MMAARHSRRTGFTLLELLLAILVTGIVALVAYAAITAGLDTLDRVDAHRRETQSRALLRPLVSDALRHIAEAGADGAAVFEITPSEGTVRGETLAFLTRGVESPLGSSGLWKLNISTSASGLNVQADPLEDTSHPSITTVVPGVHEMRVRVLQTRQDRVWVTNWNSPRQHPYAIKIELVDSAGRVIDAPLVVVTALERGS
ncbi:MAG: prepilin-type N-terminal cleavage/methylation domain-containing protein [Gemmatimonadaceae bacterium]|nr:prepilin-type N-terminal cleavage/methylation domain-containing protein [Gemmatimonadaceae bacterium]